ncbi:hypothetical protein BG46_17375 [Brucella anthropi]|uniref:TIGR03757 family integrating conjugative element protein n=1 Tax=Brucella anthropi TaxID=529 RepID=UPI00044ECF7C|nr:TIGR03757 family integrating conjugative element protein [Brucella anthropi]EXL06521.1 hypothetical protein BG46_17375 [Brucella anthropi]
MFNPFRPDARSGALGLVATIPVCAIVALLVISRASAAEVMVYTIRSSAVKAPADVAVVNLDTAETIEAGLSANLSTDPAAAVSTVRQRLQDGGAKLQRDLAAAYEAIADAWSLGITTLPAVVVDRRYVIYGEPDIAKAVARIETYRRERK